MPLGELIKSMIPSTPTPFYFHASVIGSDPQIQAWELEHSGRGGFTNIQPGTEIYVEKVRKHGVATWLEVKRRENGRTIAAASLRVVGGGSFDKKYEGTTLVCTARS